MGEDTGGAVKCLNPPQKDPAPVDFCSLKFLGRVDAGGRHHDFTAIKNGFDKKFKVVPRPGI